MRSLIASGDIEKRSISGLYFQALANSFHNRLPNGITGDDHLFFEVLSRLSPGDSQYIGEQNNERIGQSPMHGLFMRDDRDSQ